MAKTTNTNTEPAFTELDDTPVAPVAGSDTEDVAISPATGLPAFCSGKRRRIKIFTGEGDTGKFPVDLGINGYVIQVQRNVEVELPEEYVAMLSECAAGVLNSDGTPGGQTPRFAYQDLGAV